VPGTHPRPLTGGTVEKRTARLTLLIDPRKKAVFEQLCAREDVTPSQKVRQFIRDYVQQQLGDEWMDDAEAALRTKEGDD
jgi:hypothetical protein